MRLFIAEDEPPARERLIEAIARVAPQATLAGHADSVRGTAEWLATHAPPDLLLLDIQLADGLSLELFRDGAAHAPLHLPQHLPLALPVIFTTAYDRFALDAFQALALDYLLKPISDNALAQAFAKAQRLRRQFGADVAGWLDAQRAPGRDAQPQPPWRQRLMGRKGSAQMHPLAVSQLACLVSIDKLSFALTLDGTRYLIDQALAELERELDPARFFRVSRQMLLAAQAVRHYRPAGKGRLRLQLLPGLDDVVLVSQERAAAFKAWLLAAPTE